MSSNADDQAQPGLFDPVDPAIRLPDEPRTRDTVRGNAPGAATELWTVDQVADYLGVPKQTIYCWRTSGYGPVGFRVGKHLRWRASTVVAWTVELEQNG